MQFYEYHFEEIEHFLTSFLQSDFQEQIFCQKCAADTNEKAQLFNSKNQDVDGYLALALNEFQNYNSMLQYV